MAARPQPSLRARALGLLARREHSRAELGRKLAERAQGGEDVEALLDDLARRGWLSDERFAEAVVRSKARRFGPAKIEQLLRSRGVAEEAIASGVARAGADGAASLEGVWKGRFRALPGDERERARQVRFLQGRGFALEEILRFMREVERAP